MSDILKEFVVALSWLHDEASRKKVVAAEKKTTGELEKEQKAREGLEKKRREAVEKTVAGFAKMTLAAEAMALGVVAALERMAKSFAGAYYTSARTGASIKEINAFGYAVSKMGGSSESATASLEALAYQIKHVHGYRDVIKGLAKETGVKIDPDTKDSYKLIVALGEALSKLPEQRARAYQDIYPALGDESLYNAITQAKELQKQVEQYNKTAAVMGIDLEKAGRDGRDLNNEFIDLYTTIKLIGQDAASKSFDKLKKPLADLNDYLKAHGKEIAEILAKIADALLTILKYIVEHLPQLDHFVDSIGGWTNAFAAMAAIFTATFVARVAGLLASLVGLAALTMPAWLLALLGLGAAYSAGKAIDYAVDKVQEKAGVSAMESQMELDKHHLGKRSGSRKAFDWVKGKLGLGAGDGSTTGNDALWARGRKGRQARKGAAGYTGVEGGSHDISLGNAGKLSDNQKEAYAAAREEGLSEKAARALVANMSGEGLPRDAHRVHWDGRHYAHGIVQWSDVRSAAIKKQFGKMPEEMSVADQTKAAIWEIRNNPGYAQTKRALDGDNAGDMIGALVRNYESPANKGGAIAERSRIYQGLGRLGQAGMHGSGDGSVAPPIQIKPSAVVPKIPAWVGNFNPDALRATMSPPPLGTHSISNDNSKTVTYHDNKQITVHGVSDPTKASDQIGARMDRHSSLLLRNMQSAIG